MNRTVGVLALAVCALGAGCRSPELTGELPKGTADKLRDSYLENSVQAGSGRATLQDAIDLAVRNNPQIRLLRKAADVARARAKTWTDLRNPELSVAYGQGERSVDRSWLAPRAEIMPRISFPNEDNLLITSHPQDLGLDATDPSKQRVLLGPGEEAVYLARSSNTFHGTTADTEAYRVGVRFFPPNPWLTRAHGAAARAEYAAAVADVYHAEWAVQSQVKKLFARIRFLQKDLDQLNRLVEARKRMAEAASALSARRQLPIVDTMTASQRYLQVLDERDALERDLKLARSELFSVSGKTVTETGDGAPVPAGFSVEACSAEKLSEEAIQSRHDVAAAYWRSQMAMATLREARATRVPWFTQIDGSYGEAARTARPETAWEQAGGTATLDPFYSISMDDVQDTEWRVEAVMSIPLFSMGSGATRIQRADYEHSVAALGEATRLAVEEVDDALSAARDAEARAARMEIEVRPRLAETEVLLKDLQQRSDLVAAEVDRVLEAAIEMQRMLDNCLSDRDVALIQLEEAVGAALASANK